MALTKHQGRALAVLPKVAALPALLGSLYIVRDFTRDRRKRRATYHRLTAALSAFDVFTSIAYFLSTWPVPSTSSTLWASGTESTCSAQAFVIQLGLAIPFYNLSLSAYYHLVVLGDGRKVDVTVRRAEPFMHAVPCLAGLSTAVAGLPLDLYHDAKLWCWIGPNPPQLDNNFNSYRWGFFDVPLWLCILTVAALMVSLYRSVRQQEKKVQKWRAAEKSVHDLSRKVAAQSFWYVAAFVFTWIFSTVSKIVQATAGGVPFPLLVMFSFTVPCQGFFNFLVYNRGRYVQYWRMHPDGSLCGFLRRFARDTICPPKRTFSADSDKTGSNFESEFDEDDDEGDIDPSRHLAALKSRREVAMAMEISTEALDFAMDGHSLEDDARHGNDLPQKKETELKTVGETDHIVDEFGFFANEANHSEAALALFECKEDSNQNIETEWKTFRGTNYFVGKSGFSVTQKNRPEAIPPSFQCREDSHQNIEMELKAIERTDNFVDEPRISATEKSQPETAQTSFQSMGQGLGSGISAKKISCCGDGNFLPHSSDRVLHVSSIIPI